MRNKRTKIKVAIVAPYLDNFGSYHEISVRNRCHKHSYGWRMSSNSCGDVIELTL
ncbi:Uncharacterised protein [Vibrio cholerae]|nr:Uncharacterised protein [Vibrio cholerae]